MSIFYEQSSPFLARDIKPHSYWAPRRLYARLLAGEASPQEVSDQTVEVLAANRRWSLVERIGDMTKLRMKTRVLLMDYAEVAL